MVSVAYLAFTFIACILFSGVGLMIYRARQGGLALGGPSGPDLSKGDEVERWAAIQNWQSRENRVFAICVSGCAVFPVAMATAGWTSRADVLSTICTGLTSLSVNSPLCF